METTGLLHVQIVHREMVLAGVMEIANGLMDNVNGSVQFKSSAPALQV